MNNPTSVRVPFGRNAFLALLLGSVAATYTPSANATTTDNPPSGVLTDFVLYDGDALNNAGLVESGGATDGAVTVDVNATVRVDNYGNIIDANVLNGIHVRAGSSSIIYNYAGAVIQGATGISGGQFASLYINNDGTISDDNGWNAIFVGPGGNHLEIVNSGVITASGFDSAGIASYQTEWVSILNSGTIEGAADGVLIEGAGTEARIASLINSGEISGADQGVWMVATETVSFHNDVNGVVNNDVVLEAPTVYLTLDAASSINGGLSATADDAYIDLIGNAGETVFLSNVVTGGVNLISGDDVEINVNSATWVFDAASFAGSTMSVADDFDKWGDGTLVLESGLTVNIGDDFFNQEGTTIVNGDLIVADDLDNYAEIIINGFASIGEDSENHSIAIINGDLTVADYLDNYGTLIVNGTADVGYELYNGYAGYLGGSGIIYGDVYNDGFVNPGNSPGTLTIVGNYAQSSTGTLIVEVESSSNHDRLHVSGTTSLAGTVAFGGSISYGDKVRFIRSGNIVGDFDNVVTPNGIRARLFKKSTSYTALFAPEKYSQLATNSNHRSTAKALDRFISATSGDKETVSIALDHLKADEYANAFQQISPALHETIGTQAINLTQQQGRLLQQRVGTARYGLRGSFQSNTVAPALQTDRDGKSVYQSKAVKEVVTTVEEENRWSAWIEGNGVFSRVTQAHQVPNGRTRAGGFVLGTDYAWNPNFITGLFAGYEGLETKYTDESRATMNGARFGGYGTYTLDTGLYFDGVVWGGAGEYEVHRRIDFGSIDRTARSTQQTGEISAIFGTGYDWKPGNWIVGPTASVQYTYLGIDGFEEDGAKSLNLDIDRQRIHSLRSNLGARLAYRYEINENAVIVPELRASWEYEFLNDARNIDGQLGGKSITYRTEAGERASLFAGAGVNALFNNRVSMSAHYNVDLGRSNDTAHIISASFGVQW